MSRGEYNESGKSNKLNVDIRDGSQVYKRIELRKKDNLSKKEWLALIKTDRERLDRITSDFVDVAAGLGVEPEKLVNLLRGREPKISLHIKNGSVSLIHHVENIQVTKKPKGLKFDPASEDDYEVRLAVRVPSDLVEAFESSAASQGVRRKKAAFVEALSRWLAGEKTDAPFQTYHGDDKIFQVSVPREMLRALDERVAEAGMKKKTAVSQVLMTHLSLDADE